MRIQVFGAGCPACKKLFELTKKAVKEMNLPEEVEYVTDIRQLLDMGMMSSPVLAVNGKPVMVGLVPDMEKIKNAISRGSTAAGGQQPQRSCGGCC